MEEEDGALRIEGGHGLCGGAYALPVEREEAALFLCHAAAKGQRMEIKGSVWGLAPLLGSLREAGYRLEEGEERTILHPCTPHRIGLLRLEGERSEGAQTQRLQGLRLVWALAAAEEVEIAPEAITSLRGLLGEMRKLGLRLQTRPDGSLRCCARLPFFCADLEARDPRDAMALWLAAMLSEGRSYLTLQEKEKRLFLEIERRGRHEEAGIGAGGV
jgi:UDP-N-acetylglucosamine enolpyruvyl transferase